MPVKDKSKGSKELPFEKETHHRAEASIYYEKSFTKNLGNYESAKVVVGVTLPLEPTKRELELVSETITIADEIVTKELATQIDDLTK